ncbi:15219_t:CDS:2 [Rhizophagus irregularis]|nr:15219_t:CDS:2 [Rhizophagus irregularis]
MRWKCTSCKDYDLCQICKNKSHIHHHPDDHVFKLMPHSDTSNRAPQSALHLGIVCNCCNKTIHGMRWKCAFCEDYNLCQNCKSKSQSIHNHPNNHVFQPIAYSSCM